MQLYQGTQLQGHNVATLPLVRPRAVWGVSPMPTAETTINGPAWKHGFNAACQDIQHQLLLAEFVRA